MRMIDDDDDERPNKDVQNEENRKDHRWNMNKSAQATAKPEEERDGEQRHESLGMKCEGDGGQGVAHLEEIKRNNRQEVLCDG